MEAEPRGLAYGWDVPDDRLDGTTLIAAMLQFVTPTLLYSVGGRRRTMPRVDGEDHGEG